ncbi:MAG: GNAT family N-acetyltransferase [Acidimicrobiales bacterium]
MSEVRARLAEHLRSWLGAWPPPSGGVLVVGSERRELPAWDGNVQRLVGVASPHGTVLSVPPGTEERVRRLCPGVLHSGGGLAEVVGVVGGRFGRGLFRWSGAPSDLEEVGSWLPRQDPRVPEWLAPFNGEVLVALDGEGRCLAGVGRKQHDGRGHELAVVTEERARGQGLARALVAQAARRVIADGAVPTYLHDRRNVASAHVAEAAGFPDRGWEIIGLFGGRPA